MKKAQKYERHELKINKFKEALARLTPQNLSTPRGTEATVRTLLVRELERRGVKVELEVSYATPSGRLEPDLLLRDGGEYVVETKLGPEAKLIEALVQLHEYYKHTDAIGAFAILLPSELRGPMPPEVRESRAMAQSTKYIATAFFRDQRASTKYTGTLSDLADWVAQHVLRPPSYIEPDTEFAIQALQDAVEYLTADSRRIHERELEQIFGGRHVFEDILQYEEGKQPTDALRKAAIYLLVNQILFYQVLSRGDPHRYEPIDATTISQPKDLLKYFNMVLDVDYTTTFGFDIASNLPLDATARIRNVVKAVIALAPEKIRYDLLGKVFHNLIPLDIRKSVAAFYTNNEAAEMLARLAIYQPNDSVIDLACGSGTLLVAAYRAKRVLLERTKGQFTADAHKEFLENDITGIDIMPFAAHLAAIHLSLQAANYPTEKVRLAIWDSTEIDPKRTIPALAKELRKTYAQPTLDRFQNGQGQDITAEAYLKKGTITTDHIGGEDVRLKPVDVVIMNPPFTRQELLPTPYKRALSRRFADYGTILHGQFGLWGYFILLGDRFLKKTGRLACVLPARILRSKSALTLRKLLVDNYDIKFIITTNERSAFSESTMYKEMLLVAEKRKSKNEDIKLEDTATAFVILKERPHDAITAIQLANSLLATGRTLMQETQSYSIRLVRRKELIERIDNWFSYISSSEGRSIDIWSGIRNQAGNKMRSLGDILSERHGDLIRGIESRAKYGAKFFEFFVIRSKKQAKKSHDQWLLDHEDEQRLIAIDRATQEKVKIPRGAVRYGVRRASGLDKMDITNDLDYIVVNNFPNVNKFLQSKLKSGWRAWKRYVESRMSQLTISRRFDLAAPGTHLIAFYSAEPVTGQNLWSVAGFDNDEMKFLAAWFNSTVNLLQVHLTRVETRGTWMELNKYTLSSSMIPDPSKIPLSSVTKVLTKYKQISSIPLPSLLRQIEERFGPRVELDEAVLEALGKTPEEAGRILNSLYEVITNEIHVLTKQMEES